VLNTLQLAQSRTFVSNVNVTRMPLKREHSSVTVIDDKNSAAVNVRLFSVVDAN